MRVRPGAPGTHPAPGPISDGVGMDLEKKVL